MATNRRQFLGSAVGATVGLGEFGFLKQLPAVSAQEARRTIAAVEADVEPLVRLIEDTPRERIIDTIATRVRGGMGYQELLSALMLAGVRGIQPRPVGFKFHAVLVVNSAHLSSLVASDRDRWLPLFWAIENFKRSQERNRQEGDWRLAPVQGKLPGAADAGRAFSESMDNWDVENSDRAIAAWTRTAGANEIYEAFWRLGARDFRDIGHKAIYVANSYRTLQTISWRHAEPILRSLAFALLHHEGTNPAQRDAPQDRPWRDNLRRAASIRADWQRGQRPENAATGLLAALRTASPGDAADFVARQLNDRVDPACLWDGLFLTAGESLMRQPGIVGLHTVTTMNALYFAYQNSARDETRRMMLLQAASFLPMFREAMRARGRVREDIAIDTFEAVAPSARGAEAIDEIFADVSRDKTTAARKTLSLVQADPTAVHELMARGRRLIFAKGNDSHDYKFSAAALEDFFHVSSECRNRFLASSVFWLRGSGSPDTDLLERTRAALAAR